MKTELHTRRRWFMLVISIVLAFALLLASPASAANWTYTALGDSLAVGLWGFPGYVSRYKSYVQTDTGNSVTLTNKGVNGWTSTQLLNALRTSSSFQTAVSGANVVTVDIGGNDFLQARDKYKAKTCGGADNQACIRSAMTAFNGNWPAILAEILARRSTSNTVIRTMNLYNPYVNTDKAANTWPNDAGSDFQVFKPYLDDLNTSICSTATANGIPCADVYTQFNGANHDVDPRTYGYISFDGLHPNSKGHAAITGLLRKLCYLPLSAACPPQ